VDEEFAKIRFDVVGDFDLKEVQGMLDEQSHLVLCCLVDNGLEHLLMDSGDKRSMERQCMCTILRPSTTLWQSLSSLGQEMPRSVRVKAGLAREECLYRFLRTLVCLVVWFKFLRVSKVRQIYLILLNFHFLESDF
jgi:hypothetical protein